LREAVAKAVVAAIGEPPDEIVLAPPHTVLKTSSGKVRRSACRALYEAGDVGAAAPSARRQWLRLARGAVVLRLRQVVPAAGRALYALWAAAVFGPLAVVTWLLTALTTRPADAWRLGGKAAGTLLWATGTPLRVRGLQHLPTGPCVLVSNHGSYLDGMLLVAALPQPFVFVAKRELEQQFIAGVFLKRLGAEFVERFEAQRSVADAERMAEVVRQGRSLAVFPEGTFVSRPGLLPFHLGAFMAAAGAGVPVVPVVIRGHRELLPEGRWWPRRVALEVEVHAPIPPPTDAPDLFAGAARLREAARQVIAAGVEEDPATRLRSAEAA
jgi:1-acyl-sn-glycerol-3-phosphate acyltransferase